MNILHVLSSNFFAGSVSYVLNLAELQAKEKHNVFIITDNIFESKYFKSIKLPIAERSVKNRIKNILFIKKFVKENNINVLHTHSRAASWVSYFAVRHTKVPLIYTAHGILHKHKKLKTDVYGSKIIAICNNLKQQIVNEIKLDTEKIVVIHNGIDEKLLQITNKNNSKKQHKTISLIGRFNGPKGKNFSAIISEVFPLLLEKIPNLQINLIGAEWEALPDKGKQTFAQLKKNYGKRIIRIDYTDKVFDIMQNSDLVIGAGRVALESLFLQIPLFSIGEALCHGIIDNKNIDDAMNSNFGDIKQGITEFIPDTKAIYQEIYNFLLKDEAKNYTNKEILEKLERYKLAIIAKKIMKIYESCIAEKIEKKIPILMYHKVTVETIDSKHKIYVDKKKFEKQLQFFRFRNFKTLTFKDYYAFIKGEKHLSTFPKRPLIITFDDGYLSVFENALSILQKYDFKVVMFLLGDKNILQNNWDKGEQISHNRLMNKQQRQQIFRAGWEIGAHTMTHKDLTKISEQEAMKEISEAKKELSNEFKTEIITFAYPYGSYNETIKKIVEKSGYIFGIATDSGGMTIQDDRFAVFRVNMFPSENIFSLYKKTARWYRKYYKLKRKK